MTTVHPPFQFFIYRPDGSKTLLVPLDQLPSWIWIPSLEAADAFRDKTMVLASQGTIPRDNVHDAICCNCYYSSGPSNHHAPEKNTGPFPPGPPSPPGLSSTQKPSVAMPGASRTISPDDLSYSLRLPFVKPLGLETRIQNSPMVGVCLADCEWPFGGRLASFLPKHHHPPSSPSWSETTKSSLNPEAPIFNPLSAPAPYAAPDLAGVGKRANGGCSLYCVPMSNTASSESQDASRSNSPLMCQATMPQMPPSPPLTASSVRSDRVSTPEPPKKTVKATKDEEEGYSSPELDELLSRRPGHRKRIRGPLNKKSKRFRRAHRVKTKQGSRRVSFSLDRPEQVNSATKRRDRREKIKQRRNGARSGHRCYWHKMLPTWRVQTVRN